MLYLCIHYRICVFTTFLCTADLSVIKKLFKTLLVLIISIFFLQTAVEWCSDEVTEGVKLNKVSAIGHAPAAAPTAMRLRLPAALLVCAEISSYLPWQHGLVTQHQKAASTNPEEGLSVPPLFVLLPPSWSHLLRHVFVELFVSSCPIST